MVRDAHARLPAPAKVMGDDEASLRELCGQSHSAAFGFTLNADETASFRSDVDDTFYSADYACAFVLSSTMHDAMRRSSAPTGAAIRRSVSSSPGNCSRGATRCRPSTSPNVSECRGASTSRWRPDGRRRRWHQRTRWSGRGEGDGGRASGDGGAEIATGHVGLHDFPPLHLLPRRGVRPTVQRDLCELRERDTQPGRGVEHD